MFRHPVALFLALVVVQVLAVVTATPTAHTLHAAAIARVWRVQQCCEVRASDGVVQFLVAAG